MTMPTYPPARRPPHDPASLLLDGRTGWTVSAGPGGGVAEADGELRIAREPASMRPLTDPAGSFGGLRPPANVARGAGGDAWLLDATGWLKHLEPCGCEFRPVRRVTIGVGGIAVAGDRMFVTDPAAGVLAVLALPGTALSAQWRPPAPDRWRPSGVVVDRHHQVHVADPANGLLHTFGWTGRYLGAVAGIGACAHLAVDRDGVLYAAGELSAYRIADNTVTELTGRSGETADELAGRFTPSPVPVDADGAFTLAPPCTPPRPVRFSLDGNPVPGPPPAPGHPYLAAGSVTLGPLDSLLDGCTWHRVVLHGSVPAGCSVEVRTYTAEVELSAAEIVALPEPAWRTGARATGGGTDGGAAGARPWDCLVTGDRGRYLWLRLRLTGTGALTPRLAAVEVEFPRISLRRHLPAVYAADPDGAGFTDRFLALFDRELRDIEAEVDGLPAVLDPLATPFTQWLAGWVGLTLDPRLPEHTRRMLLARSARIYDQRGTPGGLREVLLLVLGMDARWAPQLVLEHFRLRRWLRLGSGRLGDDAVAWGRRLVNRSQLGGPNGSAPGDGDEARVGGTQLKATQDPLRDPFHLYAHRFTVFLPAAAGADQGQRRMLSRVLAFASPAHTAGTIEYVEPRFRIGVQASLGLDAVVARVPTGMRLAGADGTDGGPPLGRGTVLSGDPGAPPEPPRLGGTSTLH